LRDEYKEIFADYLNTWGDFGIHHIQFSVIDRETLIDAQEHPEKHDHLIIISRTETERERPNWTLYKKKQAQGKGRLLLCR